MSSGPVALAVFICLFGSALLGMRLRTLLPEHHLDDDSRRPLETGLGIIGTIAGLVLGLVVATAFGSYTTQRAAVVSLSAKLILLDLALAHAGPSAGEARVALHSSVDEMLDLMWPSNGSTPIADPSKSRGEEVYDDIEAIHPETDEQKAAKGVAASMAIDIAQQRWLMYAQLASPPPVSLIIVLVFWFSITFLGLGLFAKANTTVLVGLFLAAAAVAGAVFLIIDMYAPFSGLVKISDAPIRAALAHLGR